jgi:hypothetical protein
MAQSSAESWRRELFHGVWAAPSLANVHPPARPSAETGETCKGERHQVASRGQALFLVFDWPNRRNALVPASCPKDKTST